MFRIVGVEPLRKLLRQHRKTHKRPGVRNECQPFVMVTGDGHQDEILISTLEYRWLYDPGPLTEGMLHNCDELLLLSWSKRRQSEEAIRSCLRTKVSQQTL